MAISPVGGVIYANQQMAGVAAEVGANNNRFELQALAAAHAAGVQKKEVQEVRPTEKNQSVDADREHQREQADQEERRTSDEIEFEDEKVVKKSIHILDVKV
jgi:hypothetical protein